MRSIFGFLVFVGIIVLIDLYAYKGMNTALAGWTDVGRRWMRFIYWAVSIGLIATWVWLFVNIAELRANRNYSFVFSLVAVSMLFFLPKLVVVAFHLVEDLLELLRWAAAKMQPGSEVVTSSGGEKQPISRIRFLSQVGLALATIPFAGVLYGITHGRRNFRVERVTIRSDKLPEQFNGLRVVQISDMHLGSFPTDSDIVQRGIDLINAEEPDLILFTGDLVNDYSEEAEPWLEQLTKLEARIGKFSILGNHDYSDYARYPSREAKAANLERLKKHHATMGFRLMLDERLNIERDGEHIELLGVQNWGTKFQQYGNLAKTVAGSNPERFRLLMSHDPSHWEAQVWAEKIDLMLSGHTHGAQFGISINGQTYSPAQWFYKHWAGLYEHEGMRLYVNRGFGFIGFPGRIGMPPEITVLDLRKA
ncbi:MAG: metallophosphoesterase [Flavobacteriales bacterium]|nr:MAG: metallophosphoesterase [Flavobacteriales bacterium]